MTLNIQHCEKGLLLKYLILLERLRVSNINHSMKYDVWVCVCVCMKYDTLKTQLVD